MDYITSFPTELFEEIFQYLSLDELARCSQVSQRWWNATNINKLWFNHCLKLEIADKEFLDISKSLKMNPIERYCEPVFGSKKTCLTAPCHWRSHLSRYKFLECNWRNGRYSMKNEPLTVSKCTNGIMISRDRHLAAYSILDASKPMYIETPHVGSNPYGFYFKEDLLYYAQETDVVCEKMNNSSFTKHFIISMPTNLLKQSCLVSESHPSVRFSITNKFLLVQYLQNGCTLFFYDITTGELIRRTNLHKFYDQRCPEFTSLTTSTNTAYLAYSLEGSHYVMVYSFINDQVDGYLKSPEESSELFVSRNYIAAQTESGNGLCVWALQSYMLKLRVHGINFPNLTEDKIIYAMQRKVYVHNLGSSHPLLVEFCLEHNVAKMKVIRRNLLVVRTVASTISVYDISNGDKLYTVARGSAFRMFVGDTYIIAQGRDRNSQTFQMTIFGFW